MREAIKEAKKALEIEEVPVGAVIVKQGKIISRAHNTKETKQDSTCHAEILAIKKACKKLNSWRLLDCEMYVTLEPCSMCAGALINSRIKKIYIGTEDIKIVHEKALWHKTVHCWLYDEKGNVFFQRRSDRHTLYTTASGHLMAGETIAQGFNREIKEEIGINVDASDATLVEVVPFKMDRIKNDGSVFRDRAFANVYIDLFEGTYDDFDFDDEVSSVVLVNAKDVLALFVNNKGFIEGKEIIKTDKMSIINKKINIDEFLINEGETLLEKYGNVLKKIIEVTK